MRKVVQLWPLHDLTQMWICYGTTVLGTVDQN